MKRFATALVGFFAMAGAASAQGAAPVELTRLDCGTPAAPFGVNTRFSDTLAHKDLKLQFVFSCYVIKHGNEYMLWDTGHAASAGPVAPAKSVTEQLAEMKLTPEQIKYVGISHYHADHVGGASAFAKSTLLIGKGDWEAVTSPKPVQGVNPQLLSNWVSGGSAVETVALDKDVFGDGTVIMLYTPGHTPGHHSLLVNLQNKGPVILSGDAVHFDENYKSDGVPSFNYDRAQTIASIERIKGLVANVGATLIIQHDKRDVGKLPAFPEAAN